MHRLSDSRRVSEKFMSDVIKSFVKWSQELCGSQLVDTICVVCQIRFHNAICVSRLRAECSLRCVLHRSHGRMETLLFTLRLRNDINKKTLWRCLYIFRCLIFVYYSDVYGVYALGTSIVHVTQLIETITRIYFYQSTKKPTDL